MIDESLLESKLANVEKKGDFLERLIVCIIEDIGFSHVRKQYSGSQFGFDVEGCLSDANGGLLVWKFEGKNLAKKPTVEDIAPKLLSHQRWNELHRFVIVSRKPISNDLHHLLEGHDFPFDIDVWDLKRLTALIQFSPQAIGLLELSNESKGTLKDFPQAARYSKKDVVFHLIHADRDRPFSFDYLLPKEQVVKCYTENHFTWVGACINPTDSAVVVNEIIVRTNHYEAYDKRVFRQHKTKGLFEPIQMKFRPVPKTGGEINILPEGKRLKINPHSEEHLEIDLDDKAVSGYYELSILFKGLKDGVPRVFRSFNFPLHIKNHQSNLLQLMVVGKHYDSVAEDILDLNKNDWDELAKLVEETDEPIFLGPTQICVSQGIIEDSWKIKRMSISKTVDGGAEFDFYSKAEVIKELNLAIKEPIFSVADVLNNLGSKM